MFYVKFNLVILIVMCLNHNSSWSAEKQSQQIEDTEYGPINPYHFTDVDINFLKQFSLSSLPALPSAIGNRYADNFAAAQLGKQMFFDTRLSSNGQVSCATCHQPEKYFTDGRPQSQAIGVTRRSAPTILGASYSPWQFWDGRKDSLWAQALAPLEDAGEHGLTRTDFIKKIIRHYRKEYTAIFKNDVSQKQLEKIPSNASPLGTEEEQHRWQMINQSSRNFTNRIFSDAGKAFMAYQRQLTLPKSKFDHFINQLVNREFSKLPQTFSVSEVNGLRLFVGKANCASCHNGPLLTNYEFHNIGAPEADVKDIDMGRYDGVKNLVIDEFTCLSEWSDAAHKQCEEMRFLKKSGPELVGAFKTPTLRNIAMTEPYMQAGQFKTLEDVIAHYNIPTPPLYDPEQHPSRPHFDIMPLQLSENEVSDLISFLKTLTSPLEQTDHWWKREVP